MRPKLVVGVSVLAALLGAGSCMGIVWGVLSTVNLVPEGGLILSATLLLPIATIVFAAVFVYRHTAKRRKLQALITAVLATLITLGLFVLATILTARRGTAEPPQIIQPPSTT